MNDIIYIGFSKPKGVWFPWFSWLIRWAEHIDFSHVYIRWGSTYLERDCVYEAQSRGVNFVCSKIFNDHVEIVHEFKVSNINRKPVVQFCMDNAGIKYGVKQVFGMGYVILAKKILGKEVKNPFADGKATMVCSEMVGYILRDVLGSKCPLDLDMAGPEDLFTYVSTLPGVEKVK